MDKKKWLNGEKFRMLAELLESRLAGLELG